MRREQTEIEEIFTIKEDNNMGGRGGSSGKGGSGAGVGGNLNNSFKALESRLNGDVDDNTRKSLGWGDKEIEQFKQYSNNFIKGSLNTEDRYATVTRRGSDSKGVNMGSVVEYKNDWTGKKEKGIVVASKQYKKTGKVEYTVYGGDKHDLTTRITSDVSVLEGKKLKNKNKKKKQSV